jgi:hypothetical protein
VGKSVSQQVTNEVINMTKTARLMVELDAVIVHLSRISSIYIVEG